MGFLHMSEIEWKQNRVRLCSHLRWRLCSDSGRIMEETTQIGTLDPLNKRIGELPDPSPCYHVRKTDVKMLLVFHNVFTFVYISAFIYFLAVLYCYIHLYRQKI